jgi:hypothetical protein
MMPPTTIKIKRMALFKRLMTNAAVVANIGVVNGATIIAPITVAVELATIPPEAMIADRKIRTANRTRYGLRRAPSKNNFFSRSGRFSVVN